MRSAIAALTWELWRPNRRFAGVIVGTLVFACLFNLALPDGFRGTKADREWITTIKSVLAVASFLFVFAMFNCTEFNPQKEWSGFPYRLFALPVPTWLLVAVPMSLGVVVVELVQFAWAALVFREAEPGLMPWLAVLLGAYLVFYQTILWTLARMRMVRALVLGLTGTSFLGVAFLPFLGKLISSRWLSQKILIPAVIVLALAAFAISWISVSRQRAGGGRRRNWFAEVIDRIADALPRRRRNFHSAAAAQFWFEWRRIGWLLPLCIATLLVLVIAPLSWSIREERGATAWILIWTLALPLLLALPVGKGFSKPDFWSSDLSLPPFLAARPIASGDWIVAKLKVAALSTLMAWVLVLAFLSIWLSTWADPSALSWARMGYWMVYEHSVYPQYAIAPLAIGAAMLLTWKFLVGGLWIGHSGNRQWFAGSAAAYCLLILGLMIGLQVLANYDKNHSNAFRAALRRDPNQLLAFLEWLAASAVIAKFWTAARSWRHVSPRRVRRFLLIWFAVTPGLIALAMLLWAHGTLNLLLIFGLNFWPLDIHRLRCFLLLLALLPIPFTRLGLAAASLAKSRHT